MNFHCYQEDLIPRLAFVSQFVDQGSLNQVYRLLYVAAEDNRIELRAMNGMVYVSVHVPARVGEGRFEALVNRPIFSAIIQSLSGEIAFEEVGNRLEITQGSKERSVALADAADFPDFPMVSEDTQVTMQLSTLLSSLSLVEFAKALTRDRPILQGICLMDNYWLAGDGMRLAGLKSNTAQASHTVMVPQVIDVLRGFARLGAPDNIAITYGPTGWMELATDMCAAWVAQLAGQYPTTAIEMLEARVNSVDGTVVSLSRQDAYPTLEPIEVYASEAEMGRHSREMKLSTSEKEIKCEIDTPDGKVDDTIPVDKIVGKDTWVLLHSGLLLEALKAAPQDDIEIKIWEAHNPVLISCPGTSWAVLQTPMATKEIAEKWEQERVAAEEEEDDF